MSNPSSRPRGAILDGRTQESLVRDLWYLQKEKTEGHQKVEVWQSSIIIPYSMNVTRVDKPPPRSNPDTLDESLL